MSRSGEGTRQWGEILDEGGSGYEAVHVTVCETASLEVAVVGLWREGTT